MTKRQFYDWQSSGGGGDVLLLVETLERAEIQWCMIGGLAVNHWAAEPIVTADVDIAIAATDAARAVQALEEAGFRSQRHQSSINLKGRSAVSVQISTESIYADFPSRAIPADVHGILMRRRESRRYVAGQDPRVADPSRRRSKRQKDFLDILRLVESHPAVRTTLPADVIARLDEPHQ